jgi:gamma-glutamyltranspeptidase/glutathione hydrolase
MRAFAMLLMFAPLAVSSARCAEPFGAIVVASDRLVAEAGLQIIQSGGSAADAAVAMLMVLTVAEPQSAGIGGGAVLVRFDAAAGNVTAWDGRETAPAAAQAGEPPRAGGRAVGVPGAVRMLEALQHDHGRLSWGDVLAPAIRLAEQGIPVSAPLAEAIAGEQAALRRQPAAASVFLTPEGAPLKAGSTLANPALAQTLRAVASGGANALLRGPIAADIATTVRGDEQPGLLTTDDLAAYQPRAGAAACIPYRGATVCAPPPPAGGVVLLETLGLLGHTDLADQPPGGAESAMILIEAEALALADRARYLADPEFVPVPVAGLLSEAYLAQRARQIDPHHAINAEPGHPAALSGSPQTDMQTAQPEHGTSSMAIVDRQGNAIAMSATLDGTFGSHLFVHGFWLNAALTQFDTGSASANRIQPGKRPATSLAPAIVLDGERHVQAAIGSTGGERIPAYEAQTLAALLEWHLDPAAAVALPHVAGAPAAAALEAGTPAAELAPELTAAGQPVDVATLASGTVLIAPGPHGPVGAADPRGAGAAVSD